MDLHRISLDDKAWIDPIVFCENSKSADFNFGSMYLWDQSIAQSVGKIGNRMIVLVECEGSACFACPIGSGPLETTVKWMKEYTKRAKLPLVICGVTDEYRIKFQSLYPEEFHAEAMPAYFDYIYSVQKLATLAGKKLHGKRNHVNRFINSYQWDYQPLQPMDFSACESLFRSWGSNHDANEATLSDEFAAFQRAQAFYNKLGLEGGILRVNNEIVGFTIGEQIAADTFLVHFEKARMDIDGAYSMINREFVRQILTCHPNIHYINREDDLGLENLRKSKLSYHPEFLVRKYTLYWNKE